LNLKSLFYRTTSIQTFTNRKHASVYLQKTIGLHEVNNRSDYYECNGWSKDQF